ncbi:MAG: tetratricopeptide repeat protein [Gemmatimonadetes bacterium]|nr:tetratricopeptide repeat protein [Gemmatimonadota bacterium]
MNAAELYRAGRLDEAIEVLDVALRKDPTDVQRRTFLFELLCFAGKYDRAEKQLGVLAQSGKDAELGTLLYRSALHAERTRQEMFRTGELPLGGVTPRSVAGTLNGEPFEALLDADPRIGARLELFVAGQYTWLPFEHIESISLQPPKRLRDLLWAPAIVRPAPAFQQLELGEVLIPALTPLAWQHPEGDVRLGRVTEWEILDDERQTPVGQKLLLVDDEEFPILDVRELVITPVAAATP